MITNEASETMARIKVVDTYTKNGIKYLVFTTDVSGDEKFTLSEEEYDKYIGLENDAVDCTIYNFKCEAPIFSYKYSIFQDSDLYDCDSVRDIVDRIENVKKHGGSIILGSNNNFDISHAYGMDFDYNEFEIECRDDVKPKQIVISGKIELCRYSFTGESDFTEAEIRGIVEIMDKVNRETANYCMDAINN